MVSKRTTAKNGGRRMIIPLYAVMLIMIGLLLVMFRISGIQVTDFRERSRAFNDVLSALFEKQGIREAVDPVVRENKNAGKTWSEYSRNIQVPETVDLIALIIQLREAAKSAGLSLAVSGPDSETFTATATREGMRFAVIEARVRREPGPVSSLSGETEKVAIVIDDIGYTADISAYLDLGIPITFAVLPCERHTKDVVKELNDRGIPFILHLPMEPERYPAVDPGKAALLLTMTDDEIRKKFASDVASVPGACGVSNHMGSAFSVDEAKMRLLLELVKAQRLFYFDSMTSPGTRASQAARAVGLPFAENGIFLDLQDDPGFMKKQSDALMKKALRTGKGIAIGHIQKKFMIPVLKEIIPEFRQAGIEFVYLKDLVQVLPTGPKATIAKKIVTTTHEDSRH